MSGSPLGSAVQMILVVEHDGQRLKRSSLSSIALARRLGGVYGLMVIGSGVEEIAETARNFGAAVVLQADDPVLAEPLADRYAEVIARTVRRLDANTVIGTSSTFAKDVLPRVAALLDAEMLTDVTGVEIKESVVAFGRPASAGRLRVTVRLGGTKRVLTACGAAFPPPSPGETLSPVRRIDVDAASLPSGMRFVSREHRVSTRPDLTEARVVVSGGRPLKDHATFERLVGGLADALGGAVGATRAAVDAGMALNECQIGQTGKIVAPELYVAIGISGAIQHVAGMRDSRVIVAINRDPDAPIFQIANYGLVGDLHEIVPRLIESLHS